MNGSSQFCFHRDHSRMSKRHQEPALVFRELKPKCCFVLTRFQVFEVQGTEFWKPQAALGFGSSHTDSEEQCLEKCECPLCVGTVTVLSACPWRPLGVTKGPRKLTGKRLECSRCNSCSIMILCKFPFLCAYFLADCLPAVCKDQVIYFSVGFSCSCHVALLH